VLTVFAGGAAKYLAKAGKYEALKGAMGGTSKAAARAISSDSKAFAAFKSTYGTTPYQFSKAADEVANGTKNVVKPGLRNFLTEVKNSFIPQLKNPVTELTTYVKSGGGLNVAKLGKDVSFPQGANVLKNMPTPSKVGLMLLDGRKGLTTVQTITNTTVNLVNGNVKMDPHANPQVTLQPEKVLIKHLPGGD
jgi:hypothetical protein